MVAIILINIFVTRTSGLQKQVEKDKNLHTGCDAWSNPIFSIANSYAWIIFSLKNKTTKHTQITSKTQSRQNERKKDYITFVCNKINLPETRECLFSFFHVRQVCFPQIQVQNLDKTSLEELETE